MDSKKHNKLHGRRYSGNKTQNTIYFKIESKVGNGTNFIIVVPLHVTEEEKIEELKSQNQGNFRGINVLILLQ
jgi:hypothetical protein